LVSEVNTFFDIFGFLVWFCLLCVSQPGLQPDIAALGLPRNSGAVFLLG
jgi:hypothetical protein